MKKLLAITAIIIALVCAWRVREDRIIKSNFLSFAMDQCETRPFLSNNLVGIYPHVLYYRDGFFNETGFSFKNCVYFYGKEDAGWFAAYSISGELIGIGTWKKKKDKIHFNTGKEQEPRMINSSHYLLLLTGYNKDCIIWIRFKKIIGWHKPDDEKYGVSHHKIRLQKEQKRRKKKLSTGCIPDR